MIKIEIEIGNNLKEVMDLIAKVSDKENERRLEGYKSPGREIERAFKINFTKMISKLLKTPISLTGKDKHIKLKVDK